MAEHPSNHAVDNDYAEHEKTYVFFNKLIKWGTIGSLLILLFIGAMTSTVPWWFAFLVAILMFAASTLI